jgi:hypothetical protein
MTILSTCTGGRRPKSAKDEIAVARRDTSRAEVQAASGKASRSDPCDPPPSRGQALALFDAQHHAFGIHIADLQRGDLADTQSCTIGDAECRLVFDAWCRLQKTCANLRIVMSSIMRRRNGVIACSVMGMLLF